MRILSVVTLVSPAGEYGGPVRVAVNQAKALTDAGHDVLLVAGQRGFEAVPDQVDGATSLLFPVVRVLPRSGFAGLASPALWRWMWSNVRSFDVVHVHAARDLITLPAAAIARRRGVRYVMQTHGMIDPSGNPLTIPLDALLTRRLLRSARRVFHLTPVERDGLIAVAGAGLHLENLPNGVPEAPSAESTDPAEVLYLARLAPRKRPTAFVAAARRLASLHPDWVFTLVGPNEGEGTAVNAAIKDAAGLPITWEGALPPEQTLSRLRRASVYVLPSVDEPYPMSVLEAMSVGLPVVITDTCGLADFVAETSAGIVVDASQEALEDAIGQLLADPPAARLMGARGREAVRSRLGMPAIARQLVAAYSG